MARIRKSGQRYSSATVRAQTADTNDGAKMRNPLLDKTNKGKKGKAMRKSTSKKATKRKASSGDAPATKKRNKGDVDPNAGLVVKFEQGEEPGQAGLVLARVVKPIEEALVKSNETLAKAQKMINESHETHANAEIMIKESRGTLAQAEMIMNESGRLRDEAGRGLEAARLEREKILAMAAMVEQVEMLGEEMRRDREDACLKHEHMLRLIKALLNSAEHFREEMRRDREEACEEAWLAAQKSVTGWMRALVCVDQNAGQ